jgi:signal transduction histidine kinase
VFFTVLVLALFVEEGPPSSGYTLGLFHAKMMRSVNPHRCIVRSFSKEVHAMVTQTIAAAEHDNLLAAYQEPVELTETTFDSPLLRLLISAEREHIAQSFTERNCIPGEIIFREGEPGDTIYLIYSGRVVVLKGDFASPTILGYRGVGDIIGEMAVFENQPRSASVIALDAVRLMGVSREGFQRLLYDTPSVGLSVMAMLSSRLRSSDEARSREDLSEKHLIGQVSELRFEKQRLEELQRLQQETSDLIVHDLRNPLSTVSVAVKMLAMVLPEEVLQANRELIEIAESGCDRMQRLVNTLLEVSQMEAGESEMTWVEVDLGVMIEEVLARVSILDRKGIEVRTCIPEDLPPVAADRDKIERVLTNLVDNALKYTPAKGRITVGVEVEGSPQGALPDKRLRVTITDTGIGIPPDERQRIFERFAQVAGEKRKRRGFGLGLAYCRLAIEAHGGRIWAEPGDDGIGSRFVFTLPLR